MLAAKRCAGASASGRVAAFALHALRAVAALEHTGDACDLP
jgi:hypothetical protein